MKKHLLTILIVFYSVQMVFPQEGDGVVALDLPIRNSLVFNRYAINPTFSFVREQNKYFSINNKTEWTQFENAPETYLASFSGRFAENIGAGLAVFQQNYGVLTTFGGLLNIAYNAKLNTDSNLTFGLNIGAYKSGINMANVVTNFDDPSLQNVPSNFLLTVNPGINYGTKFLDFGVSVNNLVLYNFESSELVENNPKQGIQAHVMHTGYFDSRGFFNDAKFTAILRSEFRKDETIISGLAMLNMPKGLWLQVGYNNVYGVSGGLGLNITKQIALEYNIEKSIGELVEFGSSHEITLAYRFIPKKEYNYSGDDKVSGLFTKKRNNVVEVSEEELEGIRARAADRKAQAELDLAEAERIVKLKADTEAKLRAEEKVNKEAEAQAKKIERQKAKDEAKANAKIEAEKRAAERTKQLEEQKAREIAATKAKEDADARAQQLADQKAKEDADARAKQLADQKAKEESVSNPKDELGITMKDIEIQTEETKTQQTELLEKLDNIISIKDNDLKDLKEENDLSDQGIAIKQRPFKSITAENNALNAIKSDLDKVIKARNEKVDALQKLYDERVRIATYTTDEVTLYYKKEIKRLQSEQLKAVATTTRLETKLETIRIATEIEKKRRIKRAAFDSQDDRYSQDRAALQNIKSITSVSEIPFKSQDFDFGEDQGGNIKILKNIKNVESGYYLIIAVHSDIDKRNAFVTKVVASGRMNVDFFYDVNTSKYYIYYDKFESIERANEALKTKGNRPYNVKMSLVKIEN